MKKCLLSLLFLPIFFSSKAQWVNIPDTNFAYALSYTIGCVQGDNTVGWQLDTICADTARTYFNSRTLSFNASYPPLNDLTGISYFHNIDTFLCSLANNINHIPALPPQLIYFTIGSNPLTQLPQLPPGLQFLQCYGLHLDSLPNLPLSLKRLECYKCKLNALPGLPDSLTYLLCDSNQLTSLPQLPSNLKVLRCERNQLTVLPILPDSLLELYCGYNPLSNLPTMPAGLYSLNCEYCQLTGLPPLQPAVAVYPALFADLICNNNQLTQIPDLPYTLNRINVGSNPISCLPLLPPYTTQFYCGGTNVTCVPNYPINFVTSLPLCDGLNSNCPVYPVIQGRVYIDANGNCLNDSAEHFLANIPVQLWKNGSFNQERSTTATGTYSWVTNIGNYETRIDTADIPFYITCPVGNTLYDTIATADSGHFNKNFGLLCKTGFDLISKSIVSFDRLHPGHNALLVVSAGDNAGFYGIHCNALLSGTVTVTLTGPVTYYAPYVGALIPTSVNGNVILWSIANFDSIDFFSSFRFYVHVDSTAQEGTPICATISITPTTGDNNISNNVWTHCFDVVTSYDPNEKEVYPVGNIDTSQHELAYTSHFQNTGTDTAFNIYVTDTLDSDINPSTFQILAFSHETAVQIKGNSIRFNFPNINLPDSNTNEPASHGYVQYKVKLKDNRPIGTQINNKAYIYFDFNAPVVTNTTTNTIAINTGISEFAIVNPQFIIYPNPATDRLFIETNGMPVTEVNIYNTTGALVIQAKQPQGKSIDISQLARAVYIAEIKTREGSVKKRVVKI